MIGGLKKTHQASLSLAYIDSREGQNVSLTEYPYHDLQLVAAFTIRRRPLPSGRNLERFNCPSFFLLIASHNALSSYPTRPQSWSRRFHSVGYSTVLNLNINPKSGQPH